MKVALSVKQIELAKPGGMLADIRSLKESDIEELCALCDFCIERAEGEWYCAGGMQDFERYRQNGLGIGAFAEGMLIAYAFAAYKEGGRNASALLYSQSERRAVLDILEVVVHPDYRGNGIQKLLVGILEDIGRQVGFYKVLAGVNEKDKISIANLQHLGYEIKASSPCILEKEIKSVK